MKLGLTTISIAVAGIDGYKVTIVGNDLDDLYGDLLTRTFRFDYKAGGVPLDVALSEILRMVNEQLSR